MSNDRRALWLGLAFLLVDAACSGTADKAAATAPVVASLEEAPVPAAASSLHAFVGVVTTRDHRVVPAEFEGRVQELFVHAGQVVHAGDPIAKLDDTELQKQLAAAQAAEDAARADIARAGVETREARRKSELERRLHRRGAAAREEIRQAEFGTSRAGAGYRLASAAYRKAVAEREQLAGRLKRTTVHAPIDGVVSMIRVKEGEVARQGAAIARVFDPKDLWLRFAADPEHKDKIHEGARVSIEIPGSGIRVSAVVRHVSVDLEPPLQLLVADADIDERGVDAGLVRVGAVGPVRIDAN
jgi:multidrug efflux pump subunit AcrA (membrane-fusion protein)